MNLTKAQYLKSQDDLFFKFCTKMYMWYNQKAVFYGDLSPPEGDKSHYYTIRF